MAVEAVGNERPVRSETSWRVVRGRALRASWTRSAEPAGPHAVEQPVVLRTMLLEVEAQVEERLPEDAGIAKQQRDEEAPHPAVAVEEGVDGFKLHVCEAGADESGQAGPLLVQEALEVAHTADDVRVRRGHEQRVTRPDAA
jgi:hypothetical protein